MNAQEKINRHIEKQYLFNMGLKKWPKPKDAITPSPFGNQQNRNIAAEGILSARPQRKKRA